jgi:pimeloyl-ACP methyl ester carboxylesterase
MLAWRIVYQTMDRNGRPRAVSAMVVAPDAPAPSGGRPVVSWAHPTTGVAEGCAPSLRSDFFTQVPGLASLIGRGYDVVATDYPGLGTPGVHPYLIGDSEGRSVLDAVRAARALRAAGASARFIAWGHSQGAQGVLFAGQIAKTYAPELQLEGVVAVSPPTALTENLRDIITTVPGRLFAAYTLVSWSNLFRAPLGRVTNSPAIPIVDLVGRQCLESVMQVGAILIIAQVLTPRMLLPSFWTSEPWASVARNSSASPLRVGAPLLVVQGTRDLIVRPSITQAFVAAACAAKANVDFVWLDGGDHILAGTDSAQLAGAWMAQRFASTSRRPASCTTRHVAVPLIQQLF